MRAQRPAALVTDSDLLHGSAPRARLETGLGDAVAAAPAPLDPPVQVNDPAAPRARRPDDAAGARVRQLADQLQYREHGRLGTSAGEQRGLVLQGPGEPAAPPGPGGHRRTALITASAGSTGSIAATIPAMVAAGSRPSPGGHWPHRGWPSRSRKVTGRVLPQARRVRAADRRRRNTSPGRGVAWCAGSCRTRRKPAARSLWPLLCAARSANPR